MTDDSKESEWRWEAPSPSCSISRRWMRSRWVFAFRGPWNVKRGSLSHTVTMISKLSFTATAILAPLDQWIGNRAREMRSGDRSLNRDRNTIFNPRCRCSPPPDVLSGYIFCDFIASRKCLIKKLTRSCNWFLAEFNHSLHSENRWGVEVL